MKCESAQCPNNAVFRVGARVYCRSHANAMVMRADVDGCRVRVSLLKEASR